VNVVPVPRGPVLVVAADQLEPERQRVLEGFGQREHGRLVGQRCGQIDQLDLLGGDRGQQVGEQWHVNS
jgi:hypothetical protein